MTMKRKIDESGKSPVGHVSKKKRKSGTNSPADKHLKEVTHNIVEVKADRVENVHMKPATSHINMNNGSSKRQAKTDETHRVFKKKNRLNKKSKKKKQSDVNADLKQKDVKVDIVTEQANSKHSAQKITSNRLMSTDNSAVNHLDLNKKTVGQKWKKNFKHKKGKMKTKPDPVSVKVPKKTTAEAETSAKYPQNVNMSSNWKALQQILGKEKKCHHHRRQRRKPGGAQSSQETERKPQIWFDDVDDILIDTLKKKEEKDLSATNGKKTENKSDDRLVKTGAFQGLTRVIAMDCEMVGVGDGGRDSILARVSIVNQFGQCVYDKYVKPREAVTDYRTHVSGIRPEDIKDGSDFSEVQKEVSDMLIGRILVGHAIENDLKVLFLGHPRKKIRDTSVYKPFRELFFGRKPSLKKLSEKVLLVNVQEGEHNSVQDAQAAMRLYTMYRKQWETDLRLKRRDRPLPNKKTKLFKPSSSTS